MRTLKYVFKHGSNKMRILVIPLILCSVFCDMLRKIADVIEHNADKVAKWAGKIDYIPE